MNNRLYSYLYLHLIYIKGPASLQRFPGADPAFVIRGGPNSEHFLSNLRKLLK